MAESILVVDDERNFCSSSKFILENGRYTVDLTPSGPDTFLRLQDGSHHAMLLDLVLLYLKGIEKADLPVDIPGSEGGHLLRFFQSGRPRQAQYPGHFALSNKPFSVTSLARAIQQERRPLKERRL